MYLHSSCVRFWTGKETHINFLVAAEGLLLVAAEGLLLVSISAHAKVAHVLLELIKATPAAAWRCALPDKHRIQKVQALCIGIFILQLLCEMLKALARESFRLQYSWPYNLSNFSFPVLLKYSYYLFCLWPSISVWLLHADWWHRTTIQLTTQAQISSNLQSDFN